ncbi:holo-[acyl-carrier-protein] synthase [Companilactobacillus sp. RD055328]|uniref:holo-ACP synthase n=1 Tax=Companilactobacillus sp. RD055328 TaxID=2916634 RepID=UPI001FC8261F|nr:holo-ACP synthase [Companilactobacillus sp. RD055328]GKQ42297.1 holo-[acyl-carrier-protein] synthase [Companilactobacillus sp. RD055328]
MIKGIGIDITDITRIRTAKLEHDTFVSKILTEPEITEYINFSEKRQDEYLAARFSAKESFSKAMGTGIGKDVSFHDITILDDDKGKPSAYTKLTKDKVHISISHTDEVVMTEIIIEEVK